MFKVKNNDEIGRYLSDLIDKKYIKTRRFCKAYIQALGKEITDEEIQRQEKRILAIRKGKNAIQLEDLPVFTELFDISCEEILSAGDCHSVNENHITNYQLAFSHDERLWKSYISEDGDRFLNPDEYDKTILDYAFELKNYPLLKYLESPEKVDYQLFSPFIANEAKQKYKKQAIIFFKGQIISEFYQRLNTHLPQNV